MRQTADLDSELYQFPNESQGEDTHLMTTLKPNTEPIQNSEIFLSYDCDGKTRIIPDGKLNGECCTVENCKNLAFAMCFNNGLGLPDDGGLPN